VSDYIIMLFEYYLIFSNRTCTGHVTFLSGVYEATWASISCSIMNLTCRFMST